MDNDEILAKITLASDSLGAPFCRRGELYILTRRQLIKLMFIKRVSYKQNETCKSMTNIYISDRDNAKMNILLFDI